MATTVAQVQVVAGADVSKALSGLGSLNKSVQQSTGFFGRAASTAAGFIGGALGLQALGGVAGAANGAIFGFNSSLEQSQNAFGVMLGSGEKAASFLGDLQTFAVKTPFEFPQLIDASQRMLAFGFSADKVLPLLEDVGNAASASPSGFAQGLDRITLALGQMTAKGRVQGDELLQLQEAGINTGQVFDIMSQQTGLSTKRLQAMQKSGKLLPETFIAAFQAFSKARFGGLMDAQSRTFAGALSNITDGLRGAVATGFQPFFAWTRDAAVRLADFLMSADFKTFTANLRGLVSRAVPLLQSGLEWLLANGPNAWAWVQTAGAWIAQNRAPILGFLVGLGGALLAASAVSALAGAFATILSPLGLIAIAVGVLGAAWSTNFLDIQGKFSTAWDFLGPKLSDLRDWLETNIPAAINTLTPILQGLATGALGQLKAEVKTLNDMWQSLSNFLGPVLQGAATIFQTTIDTVVIPALKRLQQLMKGEVLPAFQTLGDRLGPLFSGLGTNVTGVLTGIGNPIAQRLGIPTEGTVNIPLPGEGRLPSFTPAQAGSTVNVNVGTVNASDPADAESLINRVAAAAVASQALAEGFAPVNLVGAS